MGIPLVGSRVPHKHPRLAPLGGIGWAWWRKGRLVALQAPVQGSFALQPLRVNQRQVYLNFKTALGGSIQVQVLGPDGQVLSGRTFEECDWLIGDHIDHPVTWGGEIDLAHRGDGPITLCFRMRCAELYSVEFK